MKLHRLRPKFGGQAQVLGAFVERVNGLASVSLLADEAVRHLKQRRWKSSEEAERNGLEHGGQRRRAKAVVTTCANDRARTVSGLRDFFVVPVLRRRGDGVAAFSATLESRESGECRDTHDTGERETNCAHLIPFRTVQILVFRSVTLVVTLFEGGPQR